MLERSRATTRSTRLIALDVDGTIAQPGASIDREILGSISQVAESGVVVVIATGRGWCDMRAVARQLPGSVYLVLNNGATTRRADGCLVDARALPFATAEAACRVYLETNVLPIWIESASSGTRYFVVRGWMDRRRYRMYLESKAPHVCCLDDRSLAPPAAQIFGLTDGGRADMLEKGIRSELGDEVSIVKWRSKRLDAVGIEILPSGITKGAVVAGIASELGVEARDAVAVGDDLNDLEMLTWAGVGLAVDGAPDALIKVADDVIAPDSLVLNQFLRDLIQVQDCERKL